jgi:hypothetical protein
MAPTCFGKTMPSSGSDGCRFTATVPQPTNRLTSYHVDFEVAQKGTQSLPDNGIVLPKHVRATVKNKEVYNSVHLLVNLYMF